MVGKYRNNRWAEKEQNILWSSWGGGKNNCNRLAVGS